MITQSESIDKISDALIQARAKMPMVGKGGFNPFDKYNYAKLDDYVKAVDDHLTAHDLTIITSSHNAESLPSRVTNNNKTEYPVRVRLTMRLVHKSGQWIQVEAVGEGQDRSDKGLYKAHTGARKYGYASLFGLATSDDPEETEQEPTQGRTQRDTPPAPENTENIRQRFAKTIKEWSGVEQSDVPDACRHFLTHNGCDPKTVTDEEVAKMNVIALACIGRKEKFPGVSAKPAGSAPVRRSASVVG